MFKMLKKKNYNKNITGMKENHWSGRGGKYGIKNDDQKARSFKTFIKVSWPFHLCIIHTFSVKDYDKY